MVCNFADDNTIFSCGNFFKVIVPSLKEDDMSRSMSWLKMVMNVSNFQVHFFGLNSNKNKVLGVGGCPIDVTNSVTLLGVKIASKLSLINMYSKIR